MTDTNSHESPVESDIDQDNPKGGEVQTAEAGGAAAPQGMFQSKFLQEWAQQLLEGDLVAISPLACFSDQEEGDRIPHLLHDRTLAAAEAETDPIKSLETITNIIKEIEATINQMLGRALKDGRIQKSRDSGVVFVGTTAWKLKSNEAMESHKKGKVISAYYNLKEYLNQKLFKFKKEIGEINLTQEQSESFKDLGEGESRPEQLADEGAKSV